MAAEARDAEIEQRRPMPLAAKLWLAGVVLMVLASATSLVLGWKMDPMATVAIGSIEGVERLGGIDIPEGARLVNARLRASMIDQDPIAWAVLDMPRADARHMLRQPPLVDPGGDRAMLTDQWGQFGGKQIEGWQPESAEEWMSAYVVESRREYWNANALADLDQEPARVYLLLER